MDDETLEARLREVGMADTAAYPLGATLRPLADDDSLAETLAAAAGQRRPRALPRLSIDLGATLPTRRDEVPGSTSEAADLTVLGLIAEGGMGRVMLAHQRSLARDVAVKTTKADAPDGTRDAILLEGMVTGRLEHPAIVPVHALGLDQRGLPAMVMKRIEGVGWNVLAEQPDHAGWEGWEGEPANRLPGHLAILIQVCNAVHFAHSRGVVHRDIKLENVLIGRFGDVYLADWGVAGEVGQREDRLCGTPGYMAPEMVGGGVVDQRTDVYLLGATLHEILTGQMRHQSAHTMAALLAARRSLPHEYDEEVPLELAELANRACHVDPAQRPATALELRDALKRFVSHHESATLGEEAVRRLEAAEEVHRVGAPEEARQRDLDRRLAEAGFGLEQSLRSWPDNPRALAARARLDAIQAERRARSAQLEREARERDPTVSSRPRAIAITFFAFCGLLMAAAGILTVETPGPVPLLGIPSAFFAVVLATTLVVRRFALETAFNRQVTLVLHLLIVLMIGGRALGLAADIPFAEHFVRDSLVICSGLAIAAVAYLRWLGWLAAIFGVCAVLCTFLPEHSLRVFALAAAAAMLLAAFFSWRGR